jgi:hypothetical protein
MSSIFNEVLYFYWLGVQGQQADLVLQDYGIISPKATNFGKQSQAITRQ